MLLCHRLDGAPGLIGAGSGLMLDAGSECGSIGENGAAVQRGRLHHGRVYLPVGVRYPQDVVDVQVEMLAEIGLGHLTVPAVDDGYHCVDVGCHGRCQCPEAVRVHIVQVDPCDRTEAPAWTGQPGDDEGVLWVEAEDDWQRPQELLRVGHFDGVGGGHAFSPCFDRLACPTDRYSLPIRSNRDNPIRGISSIF